MLKKVQNLWSKDEWKTRCDEAVVDRGKNTFLVFVCCVEINTGQRTNLFLVPFSSTPD